MFRFLLQRSIFHTRKRIFNSNIYLSHSFRKFTFNSSPSILSSRYSKNVILESEVNLKSMSGIIKKIIYHNDVNGYSVLSVTPKDIPNKHVTVIGNFVSPTLGEHIEIRDGSWKYRGEEPQIHANRIVPENPTTINETEVYLAKFFKGIGKKRAKAIVDMFGLKVFEIIENNPTALLKIPGLGAKKLENVIKPYLERVSARELVDFFAQYDIASEYGLNIWKKFGEDSIKLIKENPYILSQEIKGFTFSNADELASKMGIDHTSPIRILEGAKHTLTIGSARYGHSVLPLTYLLKECGKILNLQPFLIYEILLNEFKSEESIIRIDQNRVNLDIYSTDESINFFLNENELSSFVAKKEIYNQEFGVCKNLYRIANSNDPHPLDELMKNEPDNIIKILTDGLSDSQKEVTKLALKERVLIITGGPGVGKTATVTKIIQLFKEYNLPSLVCAPTGRAAVRLQELSGINASTVHRLLECSSGFAFQRNEENPLNCKLIVIDEFSMMDLSLTDSLLKALPSDILLVIVGDADQLPSVGSGNVLKDIIQSKKFSVCHLSEVHRQKEASNIINAAHLINKGQLPFLDHSISTNPNHITPLSSDFCYIDANSPDKIINLISSLVTYLLPKYGFKSDQIQILTPINKNDLGAKNINFTVQQQLNPYNSQKLEINFKGTIFRVGDRIMQIQNNYDKDVYNGEMGIIKDIVKDNISPTKVNGKNNTKVFVQFDRHSTMKSYTIAELEQILLSYAVTIHKSQGNEFPVIIIPLHKQHIRMLQRNLIYTAITRGKQLVIIVGDKEALNIAVSTINAQGMERYTNLTDTICKFKDNKT